ncbi:MAG: hypothetical protein AB2401_03300 [Bacillus sp. (in: firmicutes)]
MSFQEDSYKELRKALKEVKKAGIEIELITASTPPAGRPPNIRGKVKKVNDATFLLELSGPPNREGTYSIAQLIGFVPASEEEGAEAIEPAEATEATEPAEAIETTEATGPVEAIETIEATEPAETSDTTEATETTKITETAEENQA